MKDVRQGCGFLALGIMILSVLSSACENGAAGIAGPPERPAAERLAGRFLEMGCKDLGRGLLDCGDAGLEEEFGCREILEVPDEFQDLEPSFPIVVCDVPCADGEECEGAYEIGFTWPTAVRYLYLDADGDVASIQSPDEFRSVFQPVTSGAEAIAFATALTAYFGPDDRTNLGELCGETYADKEPTRALSTSDGYRLTLFDRLPCWVDYRSLVVRVTTTGEVIEEEYIPICAIAGHVDCVL